MEISNAYSIWSEYVRMQGLRIRVHDGAKPRFV
jgi:hypothetical protein